jgi:predicted RNase H-like HicB family nuclease
MNLPYTISVGQDDEGWWAKVEELPYCTTVGDSEAEVRELIKEAMQLWINESLKHGDPIPEPS